MSAFVIKLIAIAAMLTDHIGYIFFPEQIVFRIIGRLAMPIMAFFAAVGVQKTRSELKYLCRLFLFGVLSELPYRLAFNITPEHVFYPSNVIFTIFLGVLSIVIGKKLQEKLRSPYSLLIAYLPCMFLAYYFNTDWSWLGVLIIIGFYHAKDNFLKQGAFLCGAYFLFIIAEWAESFLNGTLVYGLFSPLHLWGICSLIPIFFYNGKKGTPKTLRHMFYFFYPLHLLILYFLKITI